MLVDESAMRAVQASELRHGSVNHPAGRGGVRGRRGGTVINLPDDDMLTGDDEEAVSGCGLRDVCALPSVLCCRFNVDMSLHMSAVLQRWHLAVRRRPSQHVRAG